MSMTQVQFEALAALVGMRSGPARHDQVEVSDAAFAALHRHADQCLRDVLDIASACGLRVTDVLGLPLPQKSERRPY